jgi:hypothetical protein
LESRNNHTVVVTAGDVNWSALLVAEVPPGVTTVMSTVPTGPGGAVTATCVLEMGVILLAALLPK